MADSLDELEPPDSLLAAVAARAPRARLAAGALVGERFRIVRELGAGGMGVVYLARDLELDRDVAVKLHAATANATRVGREAIAMAQLAHPNVVTVFEVGVQGARPFVVMEYVAGTTLRAWRAERERTVRDVLAMLMAAGEGLVAAHAVGIVHRDFKPENVLVHANGRARVGDFGLARAFDEPIDTGERTADAEALVTPATVTGAVLGTPGYMAPEQLAGGAADARSDQFAFCVTAWEMLWGQRPFAGDTIEAIARAVRGELRAPPKRPRVPARVRAALERGLAREPDARFASMSALLDALRAGARRRWWPYAMGAAAAIAAAGAIAIATRASEDACAAAGTDEPLPTNALVRRMIELGKPAWAERVVAANYRARYARYAQLACRRGPDAAWSEELARRSAACLHASMRAAHQLLVAARAEPTAVLVAERATALPRLEPCIDPIHLAVDARAGDDPELVAARAELATAVVDLEVHRGVLVASHLARLDASPRRDAPDIAVGRKLLRGIAALRASRTAEGVTLVAGAHEAARAIDDNAVAAIAIASLVRVGVDADRDRTETVRWVWGARADAERVAKREPSIAARLYLVAARDEIDHVESARAIDLARDAIAADPANKRVQVEALPIVGTGLLLTAHHAEGEAAFGRALAIAAELDGDDSPAMGRVLWEHANALLQVGANERALPLAARAAKLLAGGADSDDEIIAARASLGAALYQLERDDDAEPLLLRARRDSAASYGERSANVGEIDSNLAGIAIDRKNYARAIATLENAVAILEERLGKDHSKVADALYNLAAAARFVRDYPRAITAARRASDIFGLRGRGDRHRLALVLAAESANDAGDPNTALALATRVLAYTGRTEDMQVAPWAELERARALLALGRRAEALPSLARARAMYRFLKMTERVAEVERLAGAK